MLLRLRSSYKAAVVIDKDEERECDVKESSSSIVGMVVVVLGQVGRENSRSPCGRRKALS